MGHYYCYTFPFINLIPFKGTMWLDLGHVLQGQKKRRAHWIMFTRAVLWKGLWMSGSHMVWLTLETSAVDHNHTQPSDWLPSHGPWEHLAPFLLINHIEQAKGNDDDVFKHVAMKRWDNTDRCNNQVWLFLELIYHLYHRTCMVVFNFPIQSFHITVTVFNFYVLYSNKNLLCVCYKTSWNHILL